MRQEIIESIQREKVIAIVRGVGATQCLPVAKALFDGGIRLMEITYDQQDPTSWSATAGAIETIAKEYEGKLMVGAGTVTCPELVEMTHVHGGSFIISPDVNESVIQRTRDLNMVSMPGALSPTEILTAHRAGADFVKLFPASILGPAYLKAIRAPISNVRLLAVGGINEKNAADYLKAGAAGLGIGGNLAKRSWIETGKYEMLTAAAREILAAVKAAEL